MTRDQGLALIRATLTERRASEAFRLVNSPENLTAWANAKNALEELRES